MFNTRETIKMLMKGADKSSSLDAIEEKVKKVAADGRVLNIKLGLDPTAPDVHLGHAVVLRKIRQLQDLGHHATIIIGDFTAMIGDPTGRSKTRKQLTKKEVLVNAKTYQDQMFKIIKPEQTDLRFNSEWLSKMSFKDVIKLCSKSTVARLLERDDFSKRFKNQEPIALHEFFYPLMQAYDSVAIKADIELGGTDQTFNILMGRNIQKDYDCEQQVALFVPLLEGIDGVEKMSKSLGNYIGINEDANTMYEKVMKIPDSLIMRYYELTTDVHPDKIAEIKKDLAIGKNPRDVKMELARSIVSLYHSKKNTEEAEKHFISIYQQKVAPKDVETLSFKGIPAVNGKINLIDLLFSSGKYASKSEIRRLITGGAVKVDGNRQSELDFVPSEGMIVQVGKGTMFMLKK